MLKIKQTSLKNANKTCKGNIQEKTENDKQQEAAEWRNIMVITICSGSSCHLKGSRDIIAKLEELVAAHQLGDKVELSGSFCMGECVKGVCVKLDGELFSLSPDTAEAFFENEVLKRIA